MRRGMSVRYIVATLAAGALIALSVPGSRAAHDMGNDCYVCHTLGAEKVIPGTKSISSDSATGTSDPTVPIRCDYSHTGYNPGSPT